MFINFSKSVCLILMYLTLFGTNSKTLCIVQFVDPCTIAHSTVVEEEIRQVVSIDLVSRLMCGDVVSVSLSSEGPAWRSTSHAECCSDSF